jgi:metal-responsive CopG/Arc/MetJ family transcriptional regulator
MATTKKGGGVVRTIVMEDELWTELRLRAIEEKTSASEIIRRVVREYLKKPKKGGKRG